MSDKESGAFAKKISEMDQELRKRMEKVQGDSNETYKLYKQRLITIQQRNRCP
jgi:hypothetical protein